MIPNTAIADESLRAAQALGTLDGVNTLAITHPVAYAAVVMIFIIATTLFLVVKELAKNTKLTQQTAGHVTNAKFGEMVASIEMLKENGKLLADATSTITLRQSQIMGDLEAINSRGCSFARRSGYCGSAAPQTPPPPPFME